MRAHIVTRANRARYVDALDQMHRQRHALFVEELGWNALTSVDGREIDEFDDDNAVYLLTIDHGEVIGSIRFLPSWRRSLMAEKLAGFVDGEMPIGPDIWEWTRWAPGVGVSPRKAIKSRATLFAAAMEFALSRGIVMFTAVVDPKYIPLMIELGWTPEPCGLIQATTEGAPAIALKWRLSPADLSQIRTATRINRSVAIEAPLAICAASEAGDLEAFAALASLSAPSAAAEIAQSVLHQHALELPELKLVGRA
ncbi:MAG TPA: acyl-homoserine-lactone synthase [Verrucomicrobiae bacterium]|nr:acyl-homoserine-lactone synthase [Verrucomicrobiae bacterium]